MSGILYVKTYRSLVKAGSKKSTVRQRVSSVFLQACQRMAVPGKGRSSQLAAEVKAIQMQMQQIITRYWAWVWLEKIPLKEKLSAFQ